MLPRDTGESIGEGGGGKEGRGI